MNQSPGSKILWIAIWLYWQYFCNKSSLHNQWREPRSPRLGTLILHWNLTWKVYRQIDIQKVLVIFFSFIKLQGITWWRNWVYVHNVNHFWAHDISYHDYMKFRIYNKSWIRIHLNRWRSPRNITVHFWKHNFEKILLYTNQYWIKNTVKLTNSKHEASRHGKW